MGEGEECSSCGITEWTAPWERCSRSSTESSATRDIAMTPGSLCTCQKSGRSLLLPWNQTVLTNQGRVGQTSMIWGMLTFCFFVKCGLMRRCPDTVLLLLCFSSVSECLLRRESARQGAQLVATRAPSPPDVCARVSRAPPVTWWPSACFLWKLDSTPSTSH